jgi:hypothetical protein
VRIKSALPRGVGPGVGDRTVSVIVGSVPHPPLLSRDRLGRMLQTFLDCGDRGPIRSLQIFLTKGIRGGQRANRCHLSRSFLAKGTRDRGRVSRKNADLDVLSGKWARSAQTRILKRVAIHPNCARQLILGDLNLRDQGGRRFNPLSPTNLF